MSTSATEYSDATNGSEKCGSILCALIEELLNQANIQIQSVGYRVKSQESTLKKLSHTEKYKGVEEVTDLLGLRIITYFPRDVDEVAKVIRKEFTIDEGNSVDKRKLLDPDRFGYLSLHVVASLTSPRNDLAEYKRFSKAKFEIQIRSILQHTWAEIEHDLGYKTEGALPAELRRSFSRLAGLLELADEEFERIRDRLGEYEDHVDRTIKSAPQSLLINQSTLVAALQKEKVLQELDEFLSKFIGAPLKDKIEPTSVGNRVSDLKVLGIENVDQLVKTAIRYKAYIKSFATYWLTRNGEQPRRVEPINRGLGLFYLGYVLAVQKQDISSSQWRKPMRTQFPKLVDEMQTAWAKVLQDLGEPNQQPAVRT